MNAKSIQLNDSIHSTAVIHPSAEVDPSVTIGPYTVIGEGVQIGPQTRIGSHTVIEHAIIGSSCQIHSHAFVGTAPQDLKYRGETTEVHIGDGTIVRECVTINRGTAQSGKTQIGKKCLFMAYAHVAHDAVIEDEVILANSVAVAGHVQIGMGAIIGGLAGIHQFVRVGKLAMVAAGAMVPLDVPPFCSVWGDRAKLVGLNIEGMKRRHYSPSTIETLKKTYRLLFMSGKPLKQIIPHLESNGKKRIPAQLKEFLAFIKFSERGICRPRLKTEEGAMETW